MRILHSTFKEVGMVELLCTENSTDAPHQHSQHESGSTHKILRTSTSSLIECAWGHA